MRNRKLAATLILMIFTAFSCSAKGKVDKKNENIKSSVTNENVAKSVTKLNLTEKSRYSLAYMWHEEKLAYDIYSNLNKLYPTRQFQNISNSEARHISMVEYLVSDYNIDITNIKDLDGKYSVDTLKNMPIGEFKIEAIQELYNLLYEKGKKSKVDALQVGCMVEVTDVDDLDKFILEAKNNTDLISTYERLKAGSYNHYWAFDRGLKNEGITNGCCSLGSVNGVNYCKTEKEYPSMHGKGMRNGNGNRRGKGMRNGRGNGNCNR